MDKLAALLEKGAFVIGKMITEKMEVIHFFNPDSHSVVEIVRTL